MLHIQMISTWLLCLTDLAGRVLYLNPSPSEREVSFVSGYPQVLPLLNLVPLP